ncbi:MAG: chorismate-binding protein [Bacteroidales bacterium]|nr:chorismate-binding protein [Bacteroidales bacterium]
MKRNLHSLHQLLLNKGIAFARFSLPGQTEAKTYVSYLPESFSDLKSIVSIQKEGFVFAPFLVDQEHPIWFLSADDKIETGSNLQSIEEFIEQLPDAEEAWEMDQEETSRNDYAKSFDAFMQALKSSKLDKVILSKIVTKPKTGESLFQLYSRLSETYPDAFSYMIHLPNGKTWMGATPELLLKQDERTIQTMALAGTQLMQNRKIEDILWEQKEIEEQTYVRDYVKKILTGFSKSVSVSETYSVKAGNVVHLRTDFMVNQAFERINVVEMVKKLHPTPAVCGIPVKESRAMILRSEKHKRAYYTGYLGPVNASSMALFVNLRCMQVLSGSYALYVGGGITRDSILEKEWMETEAKAQTLLSVINSNEE